MTREKQHDSEDERSKKIDISPAQVAGGALASVTAAFLGSHLGVAGTFWGAGLTSVVITVGGAFYQRSLERTKVRANVAAKVALKRRVDPTRRAAQSSTEDDHVDSAAPPDPAQEPTRRISPPGTASSGMQWPGGEHVVDETSPTRRIDRASIDPGSSEPATADQEDMTRDLRWDGTRYVPASPGTDSADEPTRLVSRDEGRTEVTETQTTGRRASLLRWGTVALTAALAFGLGMLIVTGVEGLTGKPLSGNGGGTTVGRVFQPVQPPRAPVAPPPDESPSQEQTPSQPPRTSSSVPPSRETTSQPTTSAPMPPVPPTSPGTQTTAPKSPGGTEQQPPPPTGAFGTGGP